MVNFCEGFFLVYTLLTSDIQIVPVVASKIPKCIVPENTHISVQWLQNLLNYHHFCFDTMCTVEGNLSLRPSLRKVDNLDEKKWSRHKTTEQPSRLTIGQHSQHTVNRAGKERRSEGCNFAAKIYPGYQVSIDHFEVCGRVV